MIRCSYHYTVHRCTQNCNKPAKYGYVMPTTNTVYPTCEEHVKMDSWLKELGGKRYPIKKAIAIAECR